MSARTIYRVVPLDSGWVIELAGDSVKEYAAVRSEAIARAKELARRSPSGSVVVLGHDGRVEEQIEIER